jgi:hypothetical protein
LSQIIDIADAVVTAINGATLSQSVTAERFYVPVHDIEDPALHVTVVPAALDGKLLDRRGKNLFTYLVDVAVQKVIGVGSMTNDQIKAACDPLMSFAEEIADLFDGKPLGNSLVVCTNVKNVPIFAPDHLDEKRLFTSLLTLEFKAGR